MLVQRQRKADPQERKPSADRSGSPNGLCIVTTMIPAAAQPCKIIGSSSAAQRPRCRRLGLPAGRWVDAVVSSTALHWLSVVELRDLYARLARVLRPGGVFLDGDHFQEDQVLSPVLARLGRVLEEREARRRYPGGQEGRAEGWDQWWRSVAADPALAEAAVRRERGLVHHGSEGSHLAAHTAALRGAGFVEVGTLWQRGSSRVLCGVR